METIVEEWLIKKYEGVIYRIVRERKEDLKMPNHLLGHRRLFLQLCFRNVTDLLTVRRDLMPLALANGAKRSAIDAYAEVVTATESSHMDIDGPWGTEAGTSAARDKDPRDAIIDIREFDVPYYLRVAMDNEIRVGLWYTVTFNAGQPTLTQLTERVKRPDPVVMAYDIETTKAPLKFPDQAIDQVMMISYMVDGQGYLITNREIVSEDIDDFEYTPKEGYEGPFVVFNEPDEVSVGFSRSSLSANLHRFSRHPHYNASFSTFGRLNPPSWPRSMATSSIFLSYVLARKLMKSTCFWKRASL
jgi:DNA polymerase epsilon subunit 1